MKRYFAYAFILGLLFLWSCQNDLVKPTFNTNGTYTAPAVVTPSANTSIVFTAATDSIDTVQFKWSAANYKLSLAPLYTLYVKVPGQGRVALASVNGDSAKIPYVTLNSVLLNLGLPSDTAKPVTFYVVSTLPGSGVAGDSLVSTSIPMTVTCYAPAVAPVITPTYVYLGGLFEGWNNADFAPICSPLANNVYEAYINFWTVADGLKLYGSLNNWGPPSWGTTGGDTLVLDNNSGDNFSPSTPGVYYNIYNFDSMHFHQTLVTWAIIGDATPAGWNDTPMTYDSITNCWTISISLSTSGSFKFRANGAWVIDFGCDSVGNMGYADNPYYGYNKRYRDNMTVTSSGTYLVTLNLSKPGFPSYKAVLQGSNKERSDGIRRRK